MNRNVNIINDLNGGKIVIINDILFNGRQNIEWSEVEKYLKQFVGECHNIIESKDMIYIDSDLPDEFTGSNYTKKLRGTLAKAKAYDTKFALPVYNQNHDLERFIQLIK